MSTNIPQLLQLEECFIDISGGDDEREEFTVLLVAREESDDRLCCSIKDFLSDKHGDSSPSKIAIGATADWIIALAAL